MFLRSYTVKSVERKCIKYVKQLEEYTKAYDLELSEPNLSASNFLSCLSSKPPAKLIDF